MEYNEIRDVLLKVDGKPQKGQVINRDFMYYGWFEAVYINNIPLKAGKVALSINKVRIYGSANNKFLLTEMPLADIVQFGVIPK